MNKATTTEGKAVKEKNAGKKKAATLETTIAVNDEKVVEKATPKTMANGIKSKAAKNKKATPADHKVEVLQADNDSTVAAKKTAATVKKAPAKKEALVTGKNKKAVASRG